MRKIVAGLFITVDDVVEAPHEWQETFDEDMGASMSTFLPRIDTILLGRATYEFWSGYWPNIGSDHEDAAYADFINLNPKYVVSDTLDAVSWGEHDNAHLVRGDELERRLGELKAAPGKDIGVQGSPGLVNTLLQRDLLDELTLYVHNVVAYGGRKLFTEGSLKRLDLVEAKPTRTGVLIVTYRPRKG